MGAITSSPEVRLLLLSAGGSEADASLRALATEPIDWGRFLELARREGAHPPLRGRLHQAGVVVPAKVDLVLQDFQRRTELRMAYLERRLRDVLELLADGKIPVMLLKGAALSQTAYASFADRPMSDLDLLVHPEHAVRAQQNLLSRGWRQRYPGELDALYAEMHHRAPLEDARAPHLMIGLELHTEIIPPAHNPFALSAGDLWSAASRLQALPGQVSVPSDEHALLHCCVHFAWLHACTTSAWRTFRDIAAITANPAFDWDGFARMATEARAQGACFWSLHLARRAALVRVPDRVLERLRPSGLERTSRMLERHFLQEVLTPGEGCPSHKLRRALWSLAMRPRSYGHGRHRPWHAGDEHDWTRLHRSDKATAERFRGSRLRRLAGAFRYAIDLVRAPGSAPRGNA